MTWLAVAMIFAQSVSAPSGVAVANASKTSAPGPRVDISCPVGSVAVAASASSATLQNAVSAAPGGTAFCIAAGVHPWTSSVTPKSGDTFVGAVGAVLDGSGWITSDTTQGAFRAHNQDIDNVVIRNLVIRNMPQKGVNVYGPTATGWAFDHVEVFGTQRGVELGASALRSSFVHHNVVGGLTAYQAVGTIVEDSEFSFNGNETKFVGTRNVTFQRNYVHDNVNGVWFDTSNVGAFVQDNVFENNAGNAIEFEISGRDGAGADGLNVVRWNTARRSGGACVLISTSSHTQVYENTCVANFRGIQLFLNTAAIQWLATPRTQDLRDNDIHDNVVEVGPQSGAWANALSHSTTTLDMTAYTSGAANNRFARNAYRVPSATTAYWRWGTSPKTFTQWQAIPQDATGVLR